MQYHYIVIEGNIGAGKTSLAQKIAGDLNARLILEQFADNPFLPKFYQDREKYSFPLELSFLAARYNQIIKEVSTRDLFRSLTVADYYFAKSLVFARINLQDDEYDLYRQLFHIVLKQLPCPDLYVFLYMDEDRLLEHIRKRGRPYEHNIRKEYLKQITQGYFMFLKSWEQVRILILDINQLDFVADESHYRKIIDTILKEEHNFGINTVYF